MTPVFISIRDQDEPLEMMRIKILERTVYGNFDVGGVLTDGILSRIFGDTHSLELIQTLENARVCSERNVAGMIRLA